MNRSQQVAAIVLLGALGASVGLPQGRPVDWPSYGGDARRTGWEKSDLRITKDNVKDFKLVLKRKLEYGSHSLTPPVIIGLLISYRGFKELGFVASNTGNVWSIDVDTDRVFWQKQIGAAAAKGGSNCGGITAMPALTPPATFGRRRSASPLVPPSKSPGLPPTPAGRTTAAPLPSRIGGTGFGAPRPLYVLSGDGKLRHINTSDGSDQFGPLSFLPPNANASTLTLDDSVMYTSTSGNCSGVQNGVWALDLKVEEPVPATFALKGGEVGGLGGPAIGNDGTVYVQTGPGEMDPAANKYSSTLLALSPGNLELLGYFAPESGSSAKSAASHLNVTTPVVFEHSGRDLIVTASEDGRLNLLDSAEIGGSDHKTALFRTPPIASSGGGIWGGISSWEDGDGARWIAAPVWGAVNPELKFPENNGAAPNGSVVTFKVQEQSGKLALVPVWQSRDLSSPQPPVVTSGIVFALSSGDYKGQGGSLRPSGSKGAVFYAFDGATGKEMYNSGKEVTAPANLTGLSLANGRVFFTTTDGFLYAFGIHLEI